VSAAGRAKDDAEANEVINEQCVFTTVEANECGGCLNLGGRNCGAMPNALATSCRDGTCVVRKSLSLLRCRRAELIRTVARNRRLRGGVHPEG
jgi:hypothetical protein